MRLVSVLSFLLCCEILFVSGETNGGNCPDTTHTFPYLLRVYPAWSRYVTNEYLVTNWDFKCNLTLTSDGNFSPGPVSAISGLMKSFLTNPDGYGTVTNKLRYIIIIIIYLQTDPNKPLLILF